MQRVKTYANAGGLGSAQEIFGTELDQLQDGMAPVSAVLFFRSDGDLHNDLTGGDVIHTAPHRLVLGDTGERTIIVTTETNAAAGTTANTHYYVYGVITAGVETFEASTTPPVESLLYKTGDPTRRYLGHYRVDGTSILPFRKVGSSYWFRRSLIGGAPNRMRAAQVAGATAFAAMSLASYVPPHARIVHVVLDLYHDSAAASAGVRTTGDTGYEAGRVFIPNNGGTILHRQLHVSLECNASQQIDLDLTGGGTVDLFVAGWDERSN